VFRKHEPLNEYNNKWYRGHERLIIVLSKAVSITTSLLSFVQRAAESTFLPSYQLSRLSVLEATTLMNARYQVLFLNVSKRLFF